MFQKLQLNSIINNRLDHIKKILNPELDLLHFVCDFIGCHWHYENRVHIGQSS